MRSRKRNGIDCNLDPPILPIREKGPKWAFFALIEKHSMTRTDKNKHKTPTREGKIAQQKRHSTKSALKNGGPEGTRTPDLLRVKQALYQLSYRSEN